MDFKTDAALFFIDAHEQYADILAMYKTGPPVDKGFMWCSAADFPAPQGEAFNIMKRFVLDAGYDSSAYAMMQRAIQKALQDRAAPAGAAAAPAPSPAIDAFELDWTSICDARGDTIPSAMDTANAKAAKILFEDGPKKAVSHMFTREDGSKRSYSEMRSLYG